MRLNLGCGRAQLPTTIDDHFTNHLREHLPRSAYAEHWVNVDMMDIDGIDEVVDLFAYPWIKSSDDKPWEDNSAQEIWASHIIEHIPHAARLLPEASHDPLLQRAAALDGWYAWFYEAWRILEPDGLIYMVAPYATSTAAISDPTHHRMVEPGSFSYFSPNPDAPFDYQITSEFELARNVKLRTPNLAMLDIPEDASNEEKMNIAKSKWDGIDEFYIVLRAVK